MTIKPTDVVTVIMTAPDAETAETLALTLVSERLAACASVVPNIVSMYWWDGELQRDDEAMVILKTVQQRAQALEARAVEEGIAQERAAFDPFLSFAPNYREGRNPRIGGRIDSQTTSFDTILSTTMITGTEFSLTYR